MQELPLRGVGGRVWGCGWTEEQGTEEQGTEERGAAAQEGVPQIVAVAKRVRVNYLSSMNDTVLSNFETGVRKFCPLS